MYIYSVQFTYEGPKVSYPIDDEVSYQASMANIEAAKTVRRILDEARIPWKYAYSWPDGSLYLWVQSGLDENHLFGRLRELFEGETVKPQRPGRSDPASDPYKYGFRTLVEYMES